MSKVEYNQSGYIGNSMSIRAREAYENGEAPKSKWTKEAMIYAIREWCYDNDRIYVPTTESMKKDDIFKYYFRYSSWHHTSKFANPTNFYSLNENALAETMPLNDRGKEKLKQQKEKEEREEQERQRKIEIDVDRSIRLHEKEEAELKRQKEAEEEYQNKNGRSPYSPLALYHVRPGLVRVVLDYDEEEVAYVKTPSGIKKFVGEAVYAEKLYGFNCLDFPKKLSDDWKSFLRKEEPNEDFYCQHGYSPDSVIALQKIRPDLVIEKWRELEFMTPYGVDTCETHLADWWTLERGFNILDMGRNWNDFLDKTENKVLDYNRLFWSGLTPKDEIEQLKIEKSVLVDLAKEYNWISSHRGIIRVHKTEPHIKENYHTDDERYIPLGCFTSGLSFRRATTTHFRSPIEKEIKQYDKALGRLAEQNEQPELEQNNERER